ncbi:MAG TPA: lamin tail domain-containing protein [Rubricoccaceae bacterium]|nr:lamin tail domain-containing protein [Rubricoccaceae bacterium]
MRPLSLLAFVLPSLAAAQVPGPRDLVINEVMYDPPAPQPSTNEWVEIYNRSSQTRDLGTVTFSDEASTPVTVAPPGTLIQPGAFAVLVRNATAFQAAYPGVPYLAVAGFPALNNDGDTPTLRASGSGEVIDAVPYTPSWGGTDPNRSLERRDVDGPSNDPANFGLTTDPDAGTPGAPNSIAGGGDTTPPELDGASARSATEVEVVFSESVVAQPEDFTITNGIGQPVAVTIDPGAPEVVVLTLGMPLTGPQTYTLTVTNVEDLAGNVLASAQTTFFFGDFGTPAPRDVVINEVMYDPPSPQPSTNEWVELFNRSTATFDLSAFAFTDGTAAPVPVASAPTALPPGGYAVLVRDSSDFRTAFPGTPGLVLEVPGFPTLNNTGDTPTILFEGTTIDAVPYLSSWGGTDASLERRDPDAPSEFAVNWGTTTDPQRGTPGEQNGIFGPDTTGPNPVEVTVGPDGRSLAVIFDEPLDPASVAPGAFALAGPVSPAVTNAAYTATPDPTVTLTLASALEPGAYTLTVNGVRDLLGNPAQNAQVAFGFAPDRTPPTLDAAFVVDATTVEVRFSEPVNATAADPTHYSISDGVSQPASVAYPVEGDSARARLVLSTPLQARQLYTLTVAGVEDVAGNAMPATDAPLFLGEPDVPAPGDLVVNEVMFDPGDDGSEYVELFNRSPDKLFDLRTIHLSDDGADDADPISSTPVLVAPGMHVAVVADREAFAVRFPGVAAVEAEEFPSLNNDGDAVVIAYQGATVDSVQYDPAWHRIELEDATGVALERRDPAGPSNDETNWSSSLDPSGGTPGRANSVFVLPGEPPGDAGLTVDSPFDPDGGQAAALRYTLGTDAALVRARIYDGAGRLVRFLEEGNLSGRTGTLLWDGRDDAGGSLRIGIYVVLLEAVNVEGGTSEAHRAALVLARSF